MLRTFTLGATALAILATPLAAAAQNGYGGDYRDRDGNYQDGRDISRDEIRDDRRDVRDQRQDYRDAVRSGDRDRIYVEKRDYNRAQGEINRDRRDWRTYRHYDYNRPQRGYNAYYADQYYRDGRYYQPRRLSTNDRIYRGRDNRYYCRRSDGTTGLVIGAIGGGVLGGAIASGGSNTLGVLLGGIGGGLLGRSIDRNNVTCR